MIERVKISFSKERGKEPVFRRDVPVYRTLAQPLTYALRPAKPSQIFQDPVAHAEGLPARCAAYHPITEQPMMLVAGVRGYYELADPDFNVEEYNRIKEVTPAQQQAMIAGGLRGWELQEANPEWQAERLAELRAQAAQRFRKR